MQIWEPAGVSSFTKYSFCDRIQAVRGVHFWGMKTQDLSLNMIRKICGILKRIIRNHSIRYTRVAN